MKLGQFYTFSVISILHAINIILSLQNIGYQWHELKLHPEKWENVFPFFNSLIFTLRWGQITAFLRKQCGVLLHELLKMWKWEETRGEKGKEKSILCNKLMSAILMSKLWGIYCWKYFLVLKKDSSV